MKAEAEQAGRQESATGDSVRYASRVTTEETPRLLGPYALLVPLATGGMGAIYVAAPLEDLGSEQLCTVKTLRPGFVSDQEHQSRFIDEARVASALRHPNLCTMFDAGEASGEFFLAMELIEGITVHRLLALLRETHNKLEAPLALAISIHMLEGLDAAHRAVHPTTGALLGVVHRDVSPQNVMVDIAGQVKVIDFGLAVSALKETQTEADVVLGKMAYMAPEQARGLAVDATVDQFAAAVMLYEMIVGDRYYGDLPKRAIWGIAGSGMHRPRAWDQLPRQLAPILSRALAPDARRRYPNCRTMAAELKRAFPIATTPEVKNLLGTILRRLKPQELDIVNQARQVRAGLPPDMLKTMPESTQSCSVRLAPSLPFASFKAAELNPSMPSGEAPAVEVSARSVAQAPTMSGPESLRARQAPPRSSSSVELPSAHVNSGMLPRTRSLPGVIVPGQASVSQASGFQPSAYQASVSQASSSGMWSAASAMSSPAAPAAQAGGLSAASAPSVVLPRLSSSSASFSTDIGGFSGKNPRAPRPLIKQVKERLTKTRAVFPVLDPSVDDFVKLRNKPDPPLDEIVQRILRDTALTVSVLRAANSAFYKRGTQDSTNVREACVRMGIRQTFDTALEAVAQWQAQEQSNRARKVELNPRYTTLLTKMWRASAAASRLAAKFAAQIGKDPQELQAAALMHNAGEVLMTSLFSDMPDAADLDDNELAALLEKHHEEMGLGLAITWNVPRVFSSVIGNHHRPAAEPEPRELRVVRLAVLFCWKVALKSGYHYLPSQIDIDISEELKEFRVHPDTVSRYMGELQQLAL